MLPDMPARDRLPTNALFKAAEVVLPQHGIDPDDDKFAGILFKIGGERKTPRLMDKFSSVLGGMGIEIEFVPEIDPSPAPSVRSASGDSTAHSGTFPISSRYHGRRRRNSDSFAPTALDDGHPTNPATRRRSSFSSLQQVEAELPTPDNATRTVSDWLLHRPAVVPGHYGEHGVYREEDNATDEYVANAERRPVHQILEGRRHHVPKTDDGEVDETEADIALPGYLRADERPGGAQFDIFPYGNSSRRAVLPPYGHSTNHAARPPRIDDPFRPRDDNEDSVDDFSEPLRSLAPSPSADARSDGLQDMEASFSASAASHEAYPQSPGSLHSGMDWDGLRGDSDTTFQDEMDGPSPRFDPAIMAKTAGVLFAFHSLRGAASAFRAAHHRNWDRRTYAVHMDKELFVSEAVLQWSEQAGTVLRDEVTGLKHPDGQVEPDGPEGGHLQNQRNKIMRRAGRAYDLSIMHKAFTHWSVLAEGEAERTETARRHLLRRKFFGAWCQQNAEDQERVSTFTARYALRHWSKAAAEREGTHQRVATVHGDKVSGEAGWQWMAVWKQHDVAATAVIDGQDRSLLGRVARSWYVQTTRLVETERQTAERAHRGFCESTLRDWQKQAAQQRGLRQYNARHKQNRLAGVVHNWRGQVKALQEREEQLRVRNLRDWADQWRNEAKLAWHQNFQDDYLKGQAVYEWMLQERAAVLRRYHDRRRKQSAVGRLMVSFDETKADHIQLDEKATVLNKKNVLADVTSAAHEELLDHRSQLEAAQQTSTLQLAAEAFTTLAQGVASHEEMEALTRRGAYYVSTFNAMSGWAEFAKQTREDRLRVTYRHLRRAVKKTLASDCLSHWTAATDSSLASGWEADAVRSENAKSELIDTMNHWIAETNDKLIKHGIAVEGDLEVHVSKWRVQADKYQGAADDASEHDAFLEMKGCWDAWELQSVQVRGRQHTAAELGDKNNKRTTRQALGLWREASLPGFPEDPHASFAGRQSARRNMGTWRTAHYGHSSPLGPMSAFDDDRPAPALMSSPLQPITEYSEGQSYGSRVRASHASHAPPELPSPFPDMNIPASRNAPPSSSYAHRSSLPHRFGSTPLHHHSTTPLTGAADGTATLTSPPPRPADASSAAHGQESDAARPRRRFGSLQQKLDQAARLAASVQLQPPSNEGDADDYADDDDDGDDEPGPAGAFYYSGRLPRHRAALFLDTPTRPTGLPPPSAGLAAAAAAAAARSTTTPLAPLPSERERQLRHEYSSRGILLNPAEGRSSTRHESRVSFAGLRGRQGGGLAGRAGAEDEGVGEGWAGGRQG